MAENEEELKSLFMRLREESEKAGLKLNVQEREVRGRFKREGTYVYLWLIQVDVWQKPTQFYKAIIFQLKNKSISTFKTRRS